MAASSWVLAEEDALSAPTPPMGLHLANPRPPSDHPNEEFQVVRPSATPEADAEATPGEGASPNASVTRSATDAGDEAEARPTPGTTPGRDRQAQKSKNGKGRAPAAGTPAPEPGPALPWVTAIPNPARGDKVDFRVLTKGPASARIVVYNRFLDKVAKLEARGDQLFDALWSLKQVPEGLYYYQVQVNDETTGKIQVLPIQNFAVLKN